MVGSRCWPYWPSRCTRARTRRIPDQIAFADDASNSRIEKCNQYAAQVARNPAVPVEPDTVRDDDPNLVGVSDENRYSDAARVAYRDCMLGIQHDS
jgi:hypothetical protein